MPPFHDDPSAENLRRLVHYDLRTGIFVCRTHRGNLSGGSVTGNRTQQGYRFLVIDGRRYSAHRLAWLYVYGEWPPGPLDHINQNKADNGITNLRLSSPQWNSQNVTRADRRNQWGLRGIHFQTAKGKFTAAIHVDYKKYHLGTFDTAEEAHAAYLAAKAERHPGWVA